MDVLFIQNVLLQFDVNKFLKTSNNKTKKIKNNVIIKKSRNYSFTFEFF